jgi:hypothetical protein
VEKTAAGNPKDAGFTYDNKEIYGLVVIGGCSVSEKH